MRTPKEWSAQEDDREFDPAQEIAEELAEYVSGQLSPEEFGESVMGSDEECPHTRSFEQAGVLTLDQGFTFDLPDGRTVYVTVQVQ